MFAGLGLWASIQKEDNSHLSSFDEKSLYPIKITGLNYTKCEENRLMTKIKSDELKVNPRKFFIFNIKPFNEVTLNNTTIEVYLYEDTHSDTNLFSFGGDLLSVKQGNKASLKGMGLITRGVINDLVLKIYKASSLSILVKAKKAHIDFKKDETKLQKASIEGIFSNKIIKSTLIIWNEKEKIFKIPGEYIALSPMGWQRGKGIKVDLDFVLFE